MVKDGQGWSRMVQDGQGCSEILIAKDVNQLFIDGTVRVMVKEGHR